MKISPFQKSYFTERLMYWHDHENFRVLPWKKEQNAYKIWLSEIIMQQTRVEQGTPYYERFIAQYPTVQQLAAAEDTDVYRLWQGLGYYNRCRNLLATARFIANELQGHFPDDYETLLNLKGVGQYTAAAIISFAFNKPYAVVDGNVQRVLARFFGIEIPVDGTAGKKYFQQLAQDLLERSDPAGYNQSIMDFGATVCKPAVPLCEACILQPKCVAYKNQMVNLLPVKSKKNIVKTRHFNFIIFLFKKKIFIQQRQSKDIWFHLYQPYLFETSAKATEMEVNRHLQDVLKVDVALASEGESMQKLSHQTIIAQFFSARVTSPDSLRKEAGKWVAFTELKNIAFPKTIVHFFEKKGYF
ncbi:MAG TPA: A/G-specific adenine glycosylase [Flavipsychrobacter sp.]|nr:A/G-specific adenine glycosylase [Flavipsychrobacter sp.]